MKIIEEIGEAAMLEQLAEECTELAKAALKMARIIRKENPTPVTEKDAIANIREEYTDVVQCAGELSLTVDEEQMARKHERWEKRGGIEHDTIQALHKGTARIGSEI